MAISFIQPYWLLLLPLAAAMVFFMNRHIKQLVKWRRICITVSRMVIFTMLILALSGISIKSYTDDTTTVFVVDRSDSTAEWEETVGNFIQDAINEKRNKDGIGIVSFGANALVEQSVSRQPRFNGFETKIESSYSNIEEGLRLAYSLMPTDTRKHIVLITDGKENIGHTLQQVKLLREQGIVTDVFELPEKQQNDVQISQISVPEYIHINEQFDIVVNIDSNINTSAKIYLYADNQPVTHQTVEIQKGQNKFVFKDTATKGGNVVYKAVVDADIDDVLKNNEDSQFAYVKDVPHILLIQGQDEAGRELAKIFETDSDMTVIKPSAAPLELTEIQHYDCIVLSNVSAQDLDDRFMDSLESYVKHLGKGLVVTGGEDSYALGGYFRTPLERILPVDMNLKNKADIPNLGLVLVIDKSGSMSEGQYGLSKIELAKEAAIRSTEALKEQDELGVIAFDGAAQWVVKTGKVDDIRAVQEKIGSIRADGGTSILPALDQAIQSLSGRDTKLKHIILLTDGQAENYGYDGLIQTMKSQGITLSSVAVGTGADMDLLQYLAENGSGRFYKTDVFSDIPKIFTKETFLAGKTYINNRLFTPALTGFSEIMSNIESVPDLHGYVGTTAKSTAKVILSSDQDDPILASCQYGLGKVVAWTSDAKGQWTEDWMAWDQSAAFWKNILSWTLQHNQMEGYSLEGQIEGDKVNLELALEDMAADKEITGLVIDPDMHENQVRFDVTAPGKYKAQFKSDKLGAYITRINIKHADGREESIQNGMVLSYSPEYDMNHVKDKDHIGRLAEAGGGRVLENSRQVIERELEKVWSEMDITHILLVIAMLVLMCDICIRRINISHHKVQKISNQAALLWINMNNTISKKVQERRYKQKEHPQVLNTEKDNNAKQSFKKQDDQSGKNKNIQDQSEHTSRLLNMKKNRNL
ncbi:VWA domain-containing protein [Petroclostridium sp. X23]|uniref:VWA domain-containing protein n=1 Tax=Petroclostridium sp. X23 TaxID=3045146 RepID=UPI0024AD53FA|nr:VWA domain-containing protein [Petroclostridium sp. X23]WHH59611.1 VWA domain-containing protein [Petroclostridium sp. X23]